MPERLECALQYHDYLAAICFLEESQTVRIARHQNVAEHSTEGETVRFAEQIHEQVSRDFTTACCGYYDRVEKNRRDYVEANSTTSNALNATSAGFDDHLYNPATWICFGKTDATAIALVDDFYPLIEITADIRSPIDQATLAFCPKLASIGIAGRPFCEPHELFDLPRPTPDEHGIRNPSVHSFQREAPLLVVARCKLGGLVFLGQGVLMLQAILKVMAERIATVLQELGAGIDRGDPDILKLDMRKEDLDATRVAFFDAQGAEDLLVLIAGTNYSVAIAIVTTLRCLTFTDLFARHPALQVLLDQDRVPLHRAVAQIGNIVQGRGGERAVFEDFGDNHLFSLTYSTLGVTAEAFHNSNSFPQIHGSAEVYIQLDVNPGHLPEVQTRLKVAHERMLDLLRLNSVGTSIGQFKEFHRFMIGRHDYTATLAHDPQEHDLVTVRIRDFFACLRIVFGELSEVVDKGLARETGLQDLSSSLVIPFPRLERGTNAGLLLWPRKVGKRHVPLMPVLRQIRERLCDPPRKDDRARGSAEGKLSPDHRDSQMRALRIPLTLRRTIGYLYQDFAGYLADPFLFDSVLDLYDIFLGLQSWITEDLPKERMGKTTYGSFFGEQNIDELDDLLMAIQNAIMHRVYMALPNTEIRDEAVDFRGGLNKLVAAADVPLKCGLYLLDRSIDAPFGSQKGESRNPSILHGFQLGRASGVTRLTFHPRTLCHRVVGKRELCLAHLDMNVAHIFRPAEFVNYFHEAAHLIEAVRPVESEPSPPPGYRDVMWLEQGDFQHELYASLLTHLLVFGSNSDLYLRHHIASFSVHPISTGSGDGTRPALLETRVRFMEVLIRTFFVADSVRAAMELYGREPADWSIDHPWNVSGRPLTRELSAEFEERFRRTIEDYGPFFWGFESWWNNLAEAHNQEECLRRFRIALRRSYYLVAQIWRSVLKVYKEWFPAMTTDRPDEAYLEGAVHDSLAMSKPLPRSLFRSWPKTTWSFVDT